MKVLVVGSNSILSKAILRQHSEDEVEALYHNVPSSNFLVERSLSELKNLEDNYDWVYVVSAILSNQTQESESLFNVNTKLVQEISQQFPSSRLIYFSTVAVYDGLNNAVIDDKTLSSPETVYGISKLWAEKIVKEHPQYTILRISSMYGVEMKNTTFLPRIIDDALNERQIRLAGSGQRKQNYIHANDVAVLAKHLAGRNENTIQLAISSENYTNSQVAEIIQKFTDCEIVYQNVDNSRSVEYHQNKIHYSQYNFTSLEDGIKEMIEWKTK